MENVVEKTVALPAGGTVTVTIRSLAPINPDDYFILRDDALRGMGECLDSLAGAMRAPKAMEE